MPDLTLPDFAWPEAFCPCGKRLFTHLLAKSGGKICRPPRQWRLFGVFCAAAFAASPQSPLYQKNNMLICLHNS
ncbi:MAG: hypothetical protein BCS36_13745 [Desulfovibrio sp. MES5]|nr:MAG: hypothetical protein BCS36_13745 [Desulfovibrio sp. MES5]